jgi:hypothetical protein
LTFSAFANSAALQHLSPAVRANDGFEQGAVHARGG